MNLVGHSIYNATALEPQLCMNNALYPATAPRMSMGLFRRYFFINYVTTHAVASKKRGDDSEGDPPSTLRKKKGGGEVKGKTKENIS